LTRRFDVIYIPFGYQLIPIAKELDKRVIVHLHDYQAVAYNSTILPGHKKGLMQDVKAELNFELLEHGSIKRAMAGSLLVPMTVLCRNWVSEADVVICVSRRQAEIISDRAPELARKIRVVYNPLPRTPPLEERFANPTFTFAGGGSYVKGFHVLMQALLRVLKRRKSVNFMFTGGFREFRKRHVKLLEMLSSSRIGNFKLLGHLPHEDALRLYSKSHAVVVPSIWEEPLPYVVMEAMAMGTLPIASRVGGIPEIVEGTYAEDMLFEAGNVEELVERMESVLAMSREQIEDVGLSLREAMLKKFDPETIKRDLMRVFS